MDNLGNMKNRLLSEAQRQQLLNDLALRLLDLIKTLEVLRERNDARKKELADFLRRRDQLQAAALEVAKRDWRREKKAFALRYGVTR
jgi:HD superfamily phosphohydrolase